MVRTTTPPRTSQRLFKAKSTIARIMDFRPPAAGAMTGRGNDREKRPRSSRVRRRRLCHRRKREGSKSTRIRKRAEADTTQGRHGIQGFGDGKAWIQTVGGGRLSIGAKAGAAGSSSGT